MNLHEYQAKRILSKYGIKVPPNKVVSSIEEVAAAADSLGDDKFVVKAQVHAGGRGKAGGVKIVQGEEDLLSAVRSMLNTRLVTYQTDEKGQPVNQVLIESPCNIDRELYLSVVLDSSQRSIVIMASSEGGVNIEEVAESNPDKILKEYIDLELKLMPYQCRNIGFKLGLNAAQIKELTKILTSLVKLFIDNDLSLLEINPLVVTKEGNLICLDCKMNIDENALYRQPKLLEQKDLSQEDSREIDAKKWELSYIALEGNIGCLVNGAGLAMATMDLIKLQGGSPANFLDVGGGATSERVTEAFKIILADSSVSAILVNIFGGIVRCDLIAEGIIAAVSGVGVKVPVVVRLEGNNADKAREILNASKLNILAADSLTAAANKAVSIAVGGGK